MKGLVILTSILVVTAVVAVGIGVVDVNNLINNPAEELGNIGSNIQNLLSNTQDPDTPTGGTDPPDDSGTSTTDPPTGTGDMGGDTISSGRPWETVSCDIDPLPEAPGYVEQAIEQDIGWTLWDYPVNEEWPYETYKLVMNGWDIFALGTDGGLMRLDDGFWTRVETNTTHKLSNMMLGTWPSYIVGDYGTVLSYSPVTGTVKKMETPWDDLDEYDRPDLYAAWGSNHENFWALGDGVMYNYAKLSSSHPDYNASDQTPKWQWYEAPVSPCALRGPYDKHISDVWVNDYDSVFALVSNPGGGQYVTEWDGREWGDAKEIPTTSLIRSIWGFSHDNIFGVGVGGIVMHFDGVEWVEWENMKLDRWNSYSAIWGTSMTDLYCVGDWSSTGTNLMHWNGEYWAATQLPIDLGLYSVIGWGESASSVYVSGQDGVILRYIDPVDLESNIGAEKDLDWVTGTQEKGFAYFRDTASDGNYMYLCGYSWPTSRILRYSSGSGFQEISLDLGDKVMDFYSITVKDGVLYSVGVTWNEIVIIKHVISSGETSYIWDMVEESHWVPNRIIIADDGAIYVAGVTDNSIGDQVHAGFSSPPNMTSIYDDIYAYDAYLIKYSQEGEREWVRMWGNPDYPRTRHQLSGETVAGMIIDNLGRIVVAGNTETVGPLKVGTGTWGFDLNPEALGDVAIQRGYWYVVAFDENGVLLNAEGWGTGTSGSWEELKSVSLSDEGEIYLAGSSDFTGKVDNQQGTSSGNQYILKLDDQFDVLWVRLIAGDGSQQIWDSTLGPEGNLYVTGATSASIGGQNHVGAVDVFVSMIRADGLILGTQTFGGLGWDVGKLIEVDSAGYPVVWANVPSPLVVGYTEINGGLIWNLGRMPIDPYAECRVLYRDN